MIGQVVIVWGRHGTLLAVGVQKRGRGGEKRNGTGRQLQIWHRLSSYAFASGLCSGRRTRLVPSHQAGHQQIRAEVEELCILK